jgi:hydroxymethylbilane synthase
LTFPADRTIRIATRSSRLALWQAEHVAHLLRLAIPQVQVELLHVSTIGDRDLSEPLRNLGPFGVFTREVQRVVLDGQADLAVHSLKDLPTEAVDGLVLGAVPTRGELYDSLVLPASADRQRAAGKSLWESLAAGSRVGTGSPRRRAQLLHARPDLEFCEVRGNVETRLRKLDAGEFDALVLAVAGLKRLDLGQRIDEELRPPLMYPAVGQGALGLECRSDDTEVRTALRLISDAGTEAGVLAERALLADLRGGCHAPIGVATRVAGERLTLEGVVLSTDGRERLHVELEGQAALPVELGRQVAQALRDQGAERLING